MTYLDRILRQRRRDVARDLGRTSFDAVRPRPSDGRRRSLASALRAGRLGVIAEIKRRSPSAGSLAQIDDPGRLATRLAAAGAAAISVVTEPRHFGGAWHDLSRVRAAVGVPVLCKDFIVSPDHIRLAAWAGADAVLLIAAALPPAALRRALRACRDLQLEPLVEVHDERELDAAVTCGAQLIGVNNRNLKTLEVDTEIALRLAHRMPPGITRIAESGYRCADQVRDVVAAGFHGVLVGEAILRSPDPAAALRGLMAGVACFA